VSLSDDGWLLIFGDWSLGNTCVVDLGNGTFAAGGLVTEWALRRFPLNCCVVWSLKKTPAECNPHVRTGKSLFVPWIASLKSIAALPG